VRLEAISVHPNIRSRLGDACLEELCEDLWALDCQTCGLPFGGATPALNICDLPGYTDTAAYVSLHHQGCRSSQWSAQIPADNAVTSFLTQCVFLPDEWFGGSPDVHAGHEFARPTLLVNPSVETAGIECDDAGHWHVFRDGHHHLGMRRPLQGYVPGRAVAGGYATLSRHDLVAHLGSSQWPTDVTADFASEMSAYGGVTLMLTPAFGGLITDQADVVKIIVSPGTVAGWLALRNRPLP
jgi:hypothetical protein